MASDHFEVGCHYGRMRSTRNSTDADSNVTKSVQMPKSFNVKNMQQYIKGTLAVYFRTVKFAL